MSQDVIVKGNLEYRKRKQSSGERYQAVLVRCPVCGYEFTHGPSRVAHLNDHSPEDFGL